jgi:hypothetical protein
VLWLSRTVFHDCLFSQVQNNWEFLANMAFGVTTLHNPSKVTHTYSLTHARTYTHTYTHARSHTHGLTHTHMHACTHTHAHTYTHDHTLITHTHTHTHAHTHTCTQQELRGFANMQSALMNVVECQNASCFRIM